MNNIEVSEALGNTKIAAIQLEYHPTNIAYMYITLNLKNLKSVYYFLKTVLQV